MEIYDIVKAPANYIPPVLDELREKAAEYKLSAFSPSFATALCNLYAGGVINPEFSKDTRGRNNTYNFLTSLDVKGTFITDPLTSAFDLIHKLSALGESSEGCYNSGDPDILPVFNKSDPTKEIEGIEGIINKLDAFDKEILGLPEDRVEVNDIIYNDAALRKMMEIAQLLEGVKGLHTNKINSFTHNPAGKQRRLRKIKDASEIHRLRAVSLTDYVVSKTMFIKSVIDQEYNIVEKGDTTTNKQLLYVLIDGSGSMTDAFYKIPAVRGLMHNRCKAVAEGNAELYYVMFGDSIGSEVEIKDTEQARKCMEYLSNRYSYNRGGTSIDRSILQTIVNINAKHGTKPHLVIITDGGDMVRLKKEALGDIVLHAFILGNNDNLAALARSTRGVAIEGIK